MTIDNAGVVSNARDTCVDFEQSRTIMERDDAVPVEADSVAMSRRASLLRWFGRSRGEWIVLVARK